MKLAIIHDALVNLGGAERVLGAFHSMFPEAPIYTTVYLPERTHEVLRTAQIHTSWLQAIAKTETQLKLLFPLTFGVMRRLDLSAYDVVLSSSTYCAKNVEAGPGITHVCYCYAPFRPVWEYEQYTSNLNWGDFRRLCMRTMFTQFRSVDFNAGQKPKFLVAISKHAAAKLERAYGRKPVAIIYPPVDVNSYLFDTIQEDYFLVVSRLIAYKRIDIVIEAFNALKMPLKVIGTGADLARLKSLARPNIEFLGAVGESDLLDYYARCRALIFPGEEDFGLSPIEAHASGRPVIAFAKGGALETIVGADVGAAKEATGIFFHEQTADAVIKAAHEFERLSFDRDRIRRRAMLFDTAQFRSQIRSLLQEAYNGTLASGMWAESHFDQSCPTTEIQHNV
jgi:glycosyltransferase involved in cell wall biosynthesis